jgi:hypothetical protein
VTNVPGEDHRAETDAIWDLIEHAQMRLDIIDPYVADTGTLERIMAAGVAGCTFDSSYRRRRARRPCNGRLSTTSRTCKMRESPSTCTPFLPHAEVVLADYRVPV